MAKFPQDVNFSPDFPTAAAAVYARCTRPAAADQVDGVLAIDPVALSYTLKGAPGIDVGDGVTVTSDNLVSTLLSTAYREVRRAPIRASATHSWPARPARCSPR